MTGVEPNALFDFEAILMIGIASIIGTAWWIITLFLYPRATGETWYIPISDMWFGNFTFINASYVCTWVFYLFGSVLEFIAWIGFVTGPTNGQFFIMWVQHVSLHLTGWFYLLPPLFATMAIGFEEGFTPANNPAFVLMDVVGLTMWVVIGSIHLLYKGRLEKHIQSRLDVNSALTNGESG